MISAHVYDGFKDIFIGPKSIYSGIQNHRGRHYFFGSAYLYTCIYLQSDRGATPLFYALSQNNCDMVDLLLENGARLDVTMQGENEVKFHYRKYLDFSECVDSFLPVFQRETTYVMLAFKQ